jgi:hypothetical protein
MKPSGEKVMKTRVRIVTSLLALLCCVSGCKRARNRLDVTLEGPWILYQDTQFDDNGAKVPVLIAIAPDLGAVTGADDHVHYHVPQITTGDGYFILRNDIYCITFDDKCAPKGPAHLDPDGYPMGMPLLAVKFKSPTSGQAFWDWPSASKGGIALILPMPNSYSIAGTWFMRFAPKFDNHGNGYRDVDGSRHGIGVQLHYTNGPAKFNLLSCVGRPTVANCKQPASAVPNTTDTPHTQLENTGTLRIVMKAPYNDSCDPHVRDAYPRMLRLLDPTPLRTNNNANQSIGYIEPALNADAQGNPRYESDQNHDCFDNDPQKNDSSDASSIGTPLNVPLLSDQINDIRTDLSDIIAKFNLSKEDQDLLLLPAISDASKDLDPYFPRISQLSRIEQLLGESASNMEILAAQLNRQTRTQRSDRSKARLAGTNADNPQDLREALERAEEEMKSFQTKVPPKGGNDCLAALMLVNP